MTSKAIESVAEFVAWLSDDFEFADVLFRGQGGDWPLLPKIARIKLKDGSVRASEAKMLNMLRSRAISLVEHQPGTTWDWLAVAQHHGMATRLLDWTSNALAALWFAVKTPRTEQAVVWAFPTTFDEYLEDPEKEDPLSVTKTRIFRPRHLTRRIIAQAGWFTVHKYDEATTRFIPLDEQTDFEPQLTKYVIPPGAFDRIRFDLDRCGINSATLFGDLPGLCEDIEWQHSLLPDEE